jgi:uncharacterized protein YecE (DUF72 family)
MARVYVGISGWRYPPWRGVFYPVGLTQSRELSFASRQMSTIEVNGSFYSLIHPESYQAWYDETPEGFVFSVKGSRFCTNRKVLADMGKSMEVFLNQGLVELGDRLGPILWQFMGTKKYDPDDFEGFLKLLHATLEGLPLRHVVEPRHQSFQDPGFVALCRKHKVAICLADHQAYPLIPDVTADFVYVRLQTGSDDIETAYSPADLDLWTERLKTFAAGGQPKDLPVIDAAHTPAETPRDVYAFVIHEGKIRAPAAAMALLERAGERPFA